MGELWIREHVDLHSEGIVVGVGPALAILIIILFASFVLWGRSSSGRSTLERVYGYSTGQIVRGRAAAQASKTGRKPSSTSSRSRPESRQAGSNSRGTKSASRSAGKRGGRA